MHADGKSTLVSVSKWNSGKVNCVSTANRWAKSVIALQKLRFNCRLALYIYRILQEKEKITHYMLKSVQSALSDLLTTSATHGTFSRPSTKRGLILICLELNTKIMESFEHC